MSELFDVYVHPKKGAWGVTVSSQAVKAVSIVDGAIKEESIQPYRLASEIASRLKMGFTKTPRGRYLHVQEDEAGRFHGAFVVVNPELNPPSGLVLFTQKSASDDMVQLAQQWEAEVEKTDARPDEVERWVEAVKKSRDYIVAPAAHPAFALVVGDWAIKNKRILSGAHEGIPLKTPMDAPIQWREWLEKSFPGKGQKINAALEQLGMSYLAQVLKPSETIKPEGSEGGWMATFKDFSF